MYVIEYLHAFNFAYLNKINIVVLVEGVLKDTVWLNLCLKHFVQFLWLNQRQLKCGHFIIINSHTPELLNE